MRTFYDEWLQRGAENEAVLAKSPMLAKGSALDWVETPQDARCAVLIGAASGFPTQGTLLMTAEIPVGWSTGSHVHGEEAIYILDGSGFLVIDGARYDFRPGTTLAVPYMSEHQLVNTGEDPVRYLSAMSTDLDLFVRLGRFEQRSEKGPNQPDVLAGYAAEESQFAPDGRRISLHAEQMVDEYAKRSSGHDGHGHGGGGHRHGAIWILMGGSESPSEENNGFRATSAAMTNIFEEVPHSSSHCHSHTEAILYALEGSGYSEIDGQRYDWTAGDAVHVPPKMTMHEHFNDSDARTRTLRIEFGVRYFYESLWEGYAKVEHRPEAIAR